MIKWITFQRKIVTVPRLLGILLVACTLSSQITTQKFESLHKPLVTFIIPTLGRNSLKRTINKLQKQHNPNWRAIVIFDGITPTKLPVDPRIKILQIPKTGQYNHAGEVRNKGMEQVTTEWIAFVDDDDYLSFDYVDRLEEEISLNPEVEAVIFRMYHPSRLTFIPYPQAEDFSEGNVGISFSMKTNLYKAGYKFIPGCAEDFTLLELIRKRGHKMVMSPYVTYWIRHVQQEEVANMGNCSRKYIN